MGLCSILNVKGSFTKRKEEALEKQSGTAAQGDGPEPGGVRLVWRCGCRGRPSAPSRMGNITRRWSWPSRSSQIFQKTIENYLHGRRTFNETGYLWTELRILWWDCCCHVRRRIRKSAIRAHSLVGFSGGIFGGLATMGRYYYWTRPGRVKRHQNL